MNTKQIKSKLDKIAVEKSDPYQEMLNIVEEMKNILEIGGPGENMKRLFRLNTKMEHKLYEFQNLMDEEMKRMKSEWKEESDLKRRKFQMGDRVQLLFRNEEFMNKHKPNLARYQGQEGEIIDFIKSEGFHNYYKVRFDDGKELVIGSVYLEKV